MIDQKYYDHSILLNLLIQYVRVGEVNNLSEYTGEFMDKLLEFIPVMDDCIRDEDARSRCLAVTTLLIGMWPILQRCFDALRQMQQDMKQQHKNQQSNQSGSGSSSTNQAGSGSDQDDEEEGDDDAGGSAGISAESEGVG